MGPQPQIIDRRAFVLGLLFSGVVLASKLTPDSGSLSKEEEFQSSIAEPELKEFKIEDPVRELIQDADLGRPVVGDEASGFGKDREERLRESATRVARRLVEEGLSLAQARTGHVFDT